MAASKFRLAIIQLAVSSDKSTNLSRAVNFIREAASKGAQVVALPECFNSPYGIEHFGQYSEEIPGGESTKALSCAAKDNSVFIVGGSIPEADGGKLYNTCSIWGPDGSLLKKFRKVHLFDIDIPGKITFQESKTLSPGNEFVMFDTPFCKIGLGICYDLRFPELAMLYAQKGCKLLVYPGAFNMTTGPPHWELLQRGRALDNQLYVASASPAQVDGPGYVAYGHSLVVDPFGKVVAQAGGAEEVLLVDLDMDYVDEVRKQIPVPNQKRRDLYQLTTKD